MIKTVDISGFRGTPPNGDGYEACCQKMLTNALLFLADKPSFDWSGYKQYQNITGICSAENADAEALDEAVMIGLDELGGATGAMHQAVINHAAWISKRSYARWIAEGETRGHIYDPDDPERERVVLSIEGKYP